MAYIGRLAAFSKGNRQTVHMQSLTEMDVLLCMMRKPQTLYVALQDM